MGFTKVIRKKKLLDDLKDKAHNIKNRADAVADDKARDFFQELKTKGGKALIEQFKEAQNTIKYYFLIMGIK